MTTASATEPAVTASTSTAVSASAPIPNIIRSGPLTVEDGTTAEFTFEIPHDAIAISVLTVPADGDVLVQLAGLTTADNSILDMGPVDLDTMVQRFADHEVIETETGFVHEVKRGRYAFTYPFAPDRELAPGTADIWFHVKGADSVEVEVAIVRDPARTLLEVTVFSPGESRLSDDARRRVETIFDPAGLVIHWRDAMLDDGAPTRLTEIDDHTPDSDVSRLYAAVATSPDPGAKLVIVDGLPGGLSGFSDGIPGPHDGSGVAVMTTFRSQSETARIAAHEISHLLGLRHLEDRSASGSIVRNPIVDTHADAYNLMQFGTHLTEGQIAVLRLSPLLRHPDDPS
jgi:hypothetical protein